MYRVYIGFSKDRAVASNMGPCLRALMMGSDDEDHCLEKQILLFQSAPS